MKWEFVHPERDRYRFGPADRIVRFAQRHRQVVRGHPLLWHSQNSAWLEEGNFTADELRQILRGHIFRVVGRYRGRIQQWDVANEIFDDTGNLRTQDNIWIRELGPDIVAQAFRWAHQADPRAKLFFNDYGVESINAKSDAYYALIQDLQAEGVPVHGFSVQGHLSTRFGFPGDLQQNLQRFADLGVETAVTELDVRMDLPGGAAPTAEQLNQQADYYRMALEACLSADSCDPFTVWGFTDKYSWVPVFFPNQGAATITWEDFERKPAYYALLFRLAEARYGAPPEIIDTARHLGRSVALTFDAMRVHPGCDHAGVELKGHLLRWLAEHDYEPVDHGPVVYDPEDDYPVFCLRAAQGVRDERERGLDSLRVVIGGSGNDGQIAANKVPGIRSALGWNEETAALACRHNDAQVLALGGRTHALDEMTRLVELFLTTPFPGEERHRRRIEMLTTYQTTGELPPLAESAAHV